MSGGGYFGSYVDFEGTIKNEVDLIYKYRDMAMHAEIEQAIEDIANDSVVYDTRRQAVEINMDDVDLPKSIKDKVKSEFDFVLRLLNFKKKDMNFLESGTSMVDFTITSLSTSQIRKKVLLSYDQLMLRRFVRSEKLPKNQNQMQKHPLKW